MPAGINFGIYRNQAGNMLGPTLKNNTKLMLRELSAGILGIGGMRSYDKKQRTQTDAIKDVG